MTTTHPCRVVDELEPIALPELVATAELLTRVDRKYVLERARLPDLMSALPRGTRVLEIDGRREFGYRSTYLDTSDRQSFLSSGRSHRGRWKVRGRLYLDSGSSWLETKTVGPRGRTVKHRMMHPDPSELHLSDAGQEFVARVIGARLAAGLAPVLTTAYRRTTLVLPDADARVTVDVDLGWTSLTTGMDLDRRKLAIVETKTGSTPSSVDRQLWSCGHRPRRISKYGAGMAALEPDLPHLKWHRTVTRDLHLARTDPLRSRP